MMSEQDYHFLSEAGPENSDLPSLLTRERSVPTPDIFPARPKDVVCDYNAVT